MNKTEILATADDLEASASYDQNSYFNFCGTPGCVAGHVVSRHGFNVLLGTYVMAKHDVTGEIVKIEEKAAAILGLGGSQSDPLFTGEPADAAGDVIDFGDGDIDEYGCGSPPSAEQAAEVLRHLAETGEVDWERVV